MPQAGRRVRERGPASRAASSRMKATTVSVNASSCSRTSSAFSRERSSKPGNAAPAAPRLPRNSSTLMSGVLGVTWLPPSRFRSSRPPEPAGPVNLSRKTVQRATLWSISSLMNLTHRLRDTGYSSVISRSVSSGLGLNSSATPPRAFSAAALLMSLTVSRKSNAFCASFPPRRSLNASELRRPSAAAEICSRTGAAADRP
mmetsp:Transcript_10579/g.24807  ORF Transcript_10579/g.24807 Transcript_10579/m.24807 type:complete len:201 (+) Transcript_10579:354-956(+)